MSRRMVDLLWRDHPDAPGRGARGPRSRVTTGEVVARAAALADARGLDAVTIRAVAEALRISPMSVYTHVDSRDDLIVLMADEAHARMTLPAFGRARWRTRVRRVAEANLDHLRTHPWLLRITDPRTALGPGTIAKYDHELHAFDATGLDDIQRDAALSFVLDFARAGAAALTDSTDSDVGAVWSDSAPRLASYVGDGFPLARRVGAAAGEAMGAPYDADLAWRFGLDRVLAGLACLIEG